MPVDPLARCSSDQIGPDTHIGPFTEVKQGAVIGSGCWVGGQVLIDGGVVVGDGASIHNGVQLWRGTTIGDAVVIGPNATLTNARFPRGRSGEAAESFARGSRIEIGPHAELGANCTILPGIHVGRGAQVGAGAVVTQDVPANAIVVGNPARIVGYVEGRTHRGSSPDPDGGELPTSRVPGVALQRLRMATDLRGSLIAADFSRDVPFAPRRAFAVFDVPGKDVRGAHAHKVCEQLLICLRGAITCLIDDGERRQEFRLDRPDVGLHMPAMTWGSQYSYTPDATLLVLASQEYDPDDYIRDYDEFLELKRRLAGSPLAPS